MSLPRAGVLPNKTYSFFIADSMISSYRPLRVSSVVIFVPSEILSTKRSSLKTLYEFDIPKYRSIIGIMEKRNLKYLYDFVY